MNKDIYSSLALKCLSTLMLRRNNELIKLDCCIIGEWMHGIEFDCFIARAG